MIDSEEQFSKTLLALATYMDITFVVFLIPLALLIYWQQQQRRRRCRGQQQQKVAVACFIIFWIVYLLCLHGMALILLMIGNNNNNDRNHYYYYNGMNIIQDTMLHVLSFEKLTPSLSIFWYTQMQLFSRFATYFQIIFTLLPFMLIIPTAIRLYRYPFVLVRVYLIIPASCTC
jgi:GPI transamidase subunit PIG-U/8TM Microsporidial transmembrane domain